MIDVILNLTKTFPFSFLVFDKNGNIEFLNETAKLFFEHFNIESLSITNFRDLKPHFPEIYKCLEEYYTNIFTGTKSKYGVELNENYIVDLTLSPYFENNEFKYLSVIIEDKTSHYKKLKAYKTHSKFLKDIIEIRNISSVKPQYIFEKTVNLLERITNQKKSMIVLWDNAKSHNYYKGFTNKEAKSILKNKKFRELLEENDSLEEYNLTDNIYFIPNKVLIDMGIKLNSDENNMLVCALIRKKGNITGMVLIEFQENFIPYISLLEQLGMFMQFTPVILDNFIKTNEITNQANYIQSIINEIPHGVIVFDSKFNMELTNKKALKLLNGEKKGLEKEIQETLMSLIIEVITNQTKNKQFKFKDRLYEITFSRFKTSNQIKYIIVLSDITEKAKMEKELREKEKLEAIKSLFVTTNDRINNPLTVITTKLDIMEQYATRNMIDRKIISKIVTSIKNQIDKISKTLLMLDSMDKVQLVKYANMENIKQIILEDKSKDKE